MQRLVLLGGGGHASDLLAALEASEELFDVQIADDNGVELRRFAGRAEVLEGTLEEAFVREAVFLSAVGYPTPRASVVERADLVGVEWAPAVVHRDATVHPSVVLQKDSVVLGQSWLSAHAVVGEHSNIGYGVTIGHDTQIGSFAAVMPGASIGGDVCIGDRVLVGANSTVLQGITIGDRVRIGAGAVVLADVRPGATVVGSPAHELPR